MVSQRNRIIALTDYIKTFGISVNIGKNKARGNKGFFCSKNGEYRIDIAKNLDEKSVFQALVHEFVHYIHYQYDKNLQSLDFIFGEYKNIYDEDDLLKLTVDMVSQTAAKEIFERKNNIKKSINNYCLQLKEMFDSFTANQNFKPIENKIRNSDLKYLLKYDKVLVHKFWSKTEYSIIDLEQKNPNIELDVLLYLKLKSKQRALRRINSKISKLNRYYSSPTELLARSFEMYITNPELVKNKTPQLFEIYNDIIKNNKIPILSGLIQTVTIKILT